MTDIKLINGFEIRENSLNATNIIFIDIITLLKALYLNRTFLTNEEAGLIKTWFEPNKDSYVDKYITFDKKGKEHNFIKKLEKLKLVTAVKGLFQEEVRESYVLHYNILRTFYKNYKASYKKQLQSKEWKEKREDVFRERGEICERCGDKNNLQIHHKEYINNRKAWEYDNFYLEVLCRGCHSKHHGYSIER